MKDFKLLLPYLKATKLYLFLSLLCALLSTGSKLAIPILAGQAVDLIAKGQASSAVLSPYVLYIAILIVIGTFFRYFFDYWTALIGQKTVEGMRNRLYESYMNDPIAYLDSKSSGDLLSREINDVENVQTGLISGFAALYDGLVAIAFTLGFMFALNWALGLIVVALTPISILVSRFVSRYNAKNFKKQASASGALAGFSSESLTNSEAITTLNLESAREADFDALNRSFKEGNFKAAFGASLINPSTRLVNSLINASLIVVGALLILNAGPSLDALHLSLGIGGLSAFLVYAAHYMQPFNEISDVIAEIDYAWASFKRIDSAIKETPDDNAGTLRINGSIDQLAAKDMNFSYDGVRPIIKNFSLEIYKGHKIALVGPTGCGKTTLINLLMRFYDPQSGGFYANNIKTIDLEKRAFRAHIGMVLQDTWIFQGTVYENIAYAKEGASLDQVKQAASLARASSFIERLPQGYDTLISDSSGLSIGEKQLICVARVMLLAPEIVILDEATSNIDARTESLLNESFKTLLAGKTSLVVAHRLSTIVSSDLILVMKDGEILEQGNHQELLAKKGFYYELYNSQFA
jgi:ATP-binding cassette, subfamily B, multidrug efflux pump